MEASLERICRKSAQESTSAPWRLSFSGGIGRRYSSWSWKVWLRRARTRPGSSQGAAQHRPLSAHRFLARALLLRHGGIGRAGIGQRRRCSGAESFGYLAGSKRLLLLFF